MRIRGWFRRNNTLMAQAKDLARQLQEAWDEGDTLRELALGHISDMTYLRAQLHRVARERDEEREKHLAWKTTSDTWKAAAKAARTAQDQEHRLRLAAEELREHYLEQVENEEE